MQITFDPTKDQANQSKHGASLSDAVKLEWDSALDWPDERSEYGEERRCTLGLIGDRVYCVVYVDRAGARRIISLRKANKREVLKYVEAQSE